MVYTLLFFSSKCSLFHNSNVFGSCIIHILYTGCAKIKKNNSGAKRLIYPTPKTTLAAEAYLNPHIFFRNKSLNSFYMKVGSRSSGQEINRLFIVMTFALRQVHSLFQNEFSRGLDLMLSLSTSSVFSFS